MKKIFGFLIGFLLIFFLLSLQTANALTINVIQDPIPAYANSGQVRLLLKSDTDRTFIVGEDYSYFQTKIGGNPTHHNKKIDRIRPRDDKTLEIVAEIAKTDPAGDWEYQVYQGNELIAGREVYEGRYHIYPVCNPTFGCPSFEIDSQQFQAKTSAKVYLNNAQSNTFYTLWFDGEKTSLISRDFNQGEIKTDIHGHPNTATFDINVGNASSLPKRLCLSQARAFVFVTSLTCDFSIGNIFVSAKPVSSPSGPPIISGEAGVPPSASPTPTPPRGPCEKGFCVTAFADIEINPAGFIKSIFTILLSFAGIIAVILIIASGYRLMASQGNPEKVQEAREQLTSAIVGLLFIIFSLSILTIIGVDILKIPGFTR